VLTALALGATNVGSFINRDLLLNTLKKDMTFFALPYKASSLVEFL
jgi:hypothetical protein